MSAETRSTLKSYFNTGDNPTEAEFIDLIDSGLNLTDGGTVAGATTFSTGLNCNSHITASGNISASGTIFASRFESAGASNEVISFNDNLNVTGNITASGNISASGTLIGGGLNINGTTTFNDGNITNVGSITLDGINDDATSGDTNIALTGTTLNIEVGGETFLEATGTTAKFSTNVTASGYISSSFTSASSGPDGVPSVSGFEIAAHRYITRTQSVTAAGDTKDNATLISPDAGIVFVAGANNTAGVRLPLTSLVEVGTTITVMNGVAGSTLEVYPNVGEVLLPMLSTNNPATVPAGATIVCTRFGSGRWICYFGGVIS